MTEIRVGIILYGCGVLSLLGGLFFSYKKAGFAIQKEVSYEEHRFQ